jgi:hypothetical protein
MNEDLTTDGGNNQPGKNNLLTYIGLGVLLVVAVVIYWQFGQSSRNTATSMKNDEAIVENKAPEAVVELPSTVVVEDEAKKAEVVEDFGLAEVSKTFISPRSVADAVAYYKTEIVAKGGKVNSSMRTPEKEIIVATSADGKPYVVYIGEKDGETIVTINFDPVQ